jgi:hypothetical protein
MRNPFRALDEFDVFMDAVNRRISMKLLIEHARDPEHTGQYILITPQDMRYNLHFLIKSHIHGLDSSDIRIHRMSDPERGQTQIQF